MKISSLAGKRIAPDTFFRVNATDFENQVVEITAVYIQKCYKTNTVLNVSMYYRKDDGGNTCKIFSGDFSIGKISTRTKEYKALLEKAKLRTFKNLRHGLGHSFTIGSDPEMFVVNKNTKEIIPAFKFLKDKENADKCGQSNNKLYWDGFQAEFETRPGTCLQEQVNDIERMLRLLKTLSVAHDKDAIVSSATTMDVSVDDLENGKEEHVQFGCFPSYNIYGMEGIKMHGREVPFRSAGGHLHFGIGKHSEENIAKMVKALDAICAVACVSFFANMDNSRRRTMYGLAGEYRLPPHGMEYRTLSNAWLCHPLAAHMVFDLARKSLMFGLRGLLEFWKASEEEVIHTINNHDVKQAREILSRNMELFTRIIDAHCQDEPRAKIAAQAFLNGVESIIENPTDVVGNWKLNDQPGSLMRENKEFRFAAERISTGKKVG